MPNSGQKLSVQERTVVQWNLVPQPDRSHRSTVEVALKGSVLGRAHPLAEGTT